MIESNLLKIFQIDKTFIILDISIWTIGIIANIIGLFVLWISKTKLLKTEIYILFMFNVMSFAYNFLGVVLFFLVYFIYPDLFYNCAFSVFNTIWLILMPKLFMTMFYYSLFQVSSLSRHRFMLILHSTLHKTRTFLIYDLLMTIFFSAFISFIVLSAFFDENKCPSVITLTSYYILLKFLVLFQVPSILPVVVYFSATVYVFYSRHVRRAELLSNRQELLKLRKKTKLVLKFFVMAVSLAADSLLQCIYLFSLFIVPINSTLISILGNIGFLISSLQPIFLIYIHSIMKKSFKMFILTFLNRFK